MGELAGAWRCTGGGRKSAGHNLGRALARVRLRQPAKIGANDLECKVHPKLMGALIAPIQSSVGGAAGCSAHRPALERRLGQGFSREVVL